MRVARREPRPVRSLKMRRLRQLAVFHASSPARCVWLYFLVVAGDVAVAIGRRCRTRSARSMLSIGSCTAWEQSVGELGEASVLLRFGARHRARVFVEQFVERGSPACSVLLEHAPATAGGVRAAADELGVSRGLDAAQPRSASISRSDARRKLSVRCIATTSAELVPCISRSISPIVAIQRRPHISLPAVPAAALMRVHRPAPVRRAPGARALRPDRRSWRWISRASASMRWSSWPPSP